jgi:hypothetical protein
MNNIEKKLLNFHKWQISYKLVKMNKKVGTTSKNYHGFLENINCSKCIVMTCCWIWVIASGNVVTLALSSQQRQGLVRLRAKRKPGSEGKCEGMNPHTPKGACTLGVWSLGGLPNLQKAIVGIKTKWIEKFLISLKTY